jgi:hypothetical protein
MIHVDLEEPGRRRAVAAESGAKYACTTPELQGGTAMKDQVHIRNAEAAHLARTLACQTGKTISDIVLDAVRQYRPRRREPAPDRRVKRIFSLPIRDAEQSIWP